MDPCGIVRKLNGSGREFLVLEHVRLTGTTSATSVKRGGCVCPRILQPIIRISRFRSLRNIRSSRPQPQLLCPSTAHRPLHGSGSVRRTSNRWIRRLAALPPRLPWPPHPPTLRPICSGCSTSDWTTFCPTMDNRPTNTWKVRLHSADSGR